MSNETAKAECAAAEAAGVRADGLYYSYDELCDRLTGVDTTPRLIHQGNWVKPVKIAEEILWRRWEIEEWIILTTKE